MLSSFESSQNPPPFLRHDDIMGATTVELPVREMANPPNASAPKAPAAFGHALRDEHFMFAPGYRNLNHGTQLHLSSSSPINQLIRHQAPSAPSRVLSKPSSAPTKTKLKPGRTPSSGTPTRNSWTSPARPSPAS
jgi:hypothetical protein